MFKRKSTNLEVTSFIFVNFAIKYSVEEINRVNDGNNFNRYKS